MNKITLIYRTAQFKGMTEKYDKYKPAIKITDNNGHQTNWLSITETELKQIKQILIKDNNS